MGQPTHSSIDPGSHDRRFVAPSADDRQSGMGRRALEAVNDRPVSVGQILWPARAKSGMALYASIE